MRSSLGGISSPRVNSRCRGGGGEQPGPAGSRDSPSPSGGGGGKRRRVRWGRPRADTPGGGARERRGGGGGGSWEPPCVRVRGRLTHTRVWCGSAGGGGGGMARAHARPEAPLPSGGEGPAAGGSATPDGGSGELRRCAPPPHPAPGVPPAGATMDGEGQQRGLDGRTGSPRRARGPGALRAVCAEAEGGGGRRVPPRLRGAGGCGRERARRGGAGEGWGGEVPTAQRRRAASHPRARPAVPLAGGAVLRAARWPMRGGAGGGRAPPRLGV